MAILFLIGLKYSSKTQIGTVGYNTNATGKYVRITMDEDNIFNFNNMQDIF